MCQLRGANKCVNAWEQRALRATEEQRREPGKVTHWNKPHQCEKHFNRFNCI